MTKLKLHIKKILEKLKSTVPINKLHLLITMNLHLQEPMTKPYNHLAEPVPHNNIICP